ncbi:MAG: GNAT family N-acetyltransferase [Lachnospiraceae bacterium]|nr:GNAT family N-acetyltransferase [Lachnospiraceae bacterium]
MYTIRSYQEKARKVVEGICIGTSDYFSQNPLMREALLQVFCHYYIEKEPGNCFVAVDENDRAVGYILCAENFSEWEQLFQKDYIELSDNPATKMMGPGTIDGLKDFAADYPAHLHIDLNEGCQRQGLGTRLMDTLLAHLREKGISGVMLCVAADNEKGKSFYHKYGFTVLEKTDREITMGMKLG